MNLTFIEVHPYKTGSSNKFGKNIIYVTTKVKI